VRLGEFAAFYEAEFKKVPLTALPAGERLLEVVHRHHRVIYRIPRRIVEVWTSGALLLVASPVLLLAALAIRLTSRGPALYRQRRVGRAGKPFTLVKLRTMTIGPQQEACWAQSDAHRVTRIGSHLRRFRIDELPQLWNVLRGDLALIGPRPEQVPIVDRLRQELPHYSLRHCIRPGITGWAQVNLGYAGSVEGALAKLERDLFYVKRRSLRLDALIVWLTLKTVLAGRGA
jgi:lipopolysaccharide/colanic/teichoic acid biosynthesis glycosyltransferase